MSEFDLIEHAFRHPHPFQHALTRVPNGDDASVHDVPAGMQLVVSTDMSLAGVHWPHDFPLQFAARRAVNAALSDLAAMGAEASWIWVCAGLRDVRAGEAMGKGIAMALHGTGIELAGGDTVHAGQDSLSVTVAGLVPGGGAMRRDTAKAGEEVWLCGRLGRASQALERWQQGERSDQVAGDFANVIPMLAEGVRLREAGVRCCIDVSDGLLADAQHLADNSGVGIDIELSDIPCMHELSQSLGNEAAARFVLAGGEDYALLCTAPAALHDSLKHIGVCIGVCTGCVGEVTAWQNGVAVHVPQRGFDHFA